MRTVLAVDGGNSKTDVALVADDGRLLGAVRGPTSSHQAVGLDRGMERLAALVAEVHGQAGLVESPGRRPEVAVYGLAGADSPRDVRLLQGALAARGFANQDVLRNDTFAALRAGTDRGWGVVLICGSGVNAGGLAPDGREARLAALGDISGDWGGGNDVGYAGLAAAVRARDGRGRRTRLERDVPAHFGLVRPSTLTAALYDGRIDARRVGELSAVVFAAAGAGDAVARSIVDRMADELTAMAGAMLRRLHLTRLDPDVVLGGGVFRTDEAGFYERLDVSIRGIAPRARLVRLSAPPVAGAALSALDRLGVAGVGPVVRAAFAAWDEAANHQAS